MNNDKVVLESDRLLLRNIKMSDVDDFLYYRSIPEVATYQGWEPYKEEDAVNYINIYKDNIPGIPGDWCSWAIIHKEDDKLIGDCSIKLTKDEPRIAEIGCTLSPDYQGRGIAKESISAMIDYAFENLDVHRIVGITDAKNLPSQKLMESMGMRKEGHFIKNIWFKGEWGDECQYAILKDEWQNLSK
ncbi:MAG: GNAT family N-acetyltransferase [Bacteroidetes bacterium]|nr:GNAT family N-acetyltransferase [Bacteroidota bacterium]